MWMGFDFTNIGGNRHCLHVWMDVDLAVFTGTDYIHGCKFINLIKHDTIYNVYVVYMLQFCTSYNMYKITVHVIT